MRRDRTTTESRALLQTPQAGTVLACWTALSPYKHPRRGLTGVLHRHVDLAVVLEEWRKDLSLLGALRKESSWGELGSTGSAREEKNEARKA